MPTEDPKPQKSTTPHRSNPEKQKLLTEFGLMVMRLEKNLIRHLKTKFCIDQVGAEEMISQALLIVVRTIDSYREECGPRQWYQTILENCTRSFLRTKKNRRRHKSLDYSEQIEDERLSLVSEQPEQQDDLTQIWEAAGKLSKQASEVMDDFYGRGLTYNEIAKNRNLKLTCVRQLVCRSLNFIRSSLGVPSPPRRPESR